jgi:pyruvate dehydrogenase E2 component (dihydrolipoamide acetyltransferase)
MYFINYVRFNNNCKNYIKYLKLYLYIQVKCLFLKEINFAIMANVVIMPRQGQSVETCIIGSWNKKVGDQVKTGDILFSYETDKASFDEEAKADGELLAVFFKEGEEVPVLTNVAVIGSKGESIEEFRTGGKSITPSTESVTIVSEVPRDIEKKVIPPLEAQKGKIKISPRAKKLAEKLGLPVNILKGSGPNGRIIVQDVEAAIQENAETENITAARETKSREVITYAQVAGEDFDVKKLTHMRKLIAKAMLQSLQNSAQLTHHMSADARRIMSLRKIFKKKFETGELSQNITINDMVCFAAIKALKKFPQANSHFIGDSMRWFKKIHLGLAVDTERGLMVPAIKNADDLSIEGLSSQLSVIAAQCRKGSLDPELLKPEAASFTISNLGNYGVEMFTPVINIPQTAILGVCTIVPRPKDLGDGVYGFVPMIGLSLTYDHQALDGGEATLFLKEIKEQIENLLSD